MHLAARQRSCGQGWVIPGAGIAPAHSRCGRSKGLTLSSGIVPGGLGGSGRELADQRQYKSHNGKHIGSNDTNLVGKRTNVLEITIHVTQQG
jgi:hypothetical protein